MTARPADLTNFIARLTAQLASGTGPLGPPSASSSPMFFSRAPGRLDVMGGIADYSGSLVLQWPIREATRVALERHAQPTLRIASVGRDRVRRVEVPLAVFAGGAAPYEQVRAWFAADSDRHWAAYVAGVFHVLAKEHGLPLHGGARVIVESDVPEGKGVSSSAAIEAATMEAVLAAWELTLPPRLRAIRCQQVENLIVGAPCGVMDQMASISGEAGSLMALLCQPAEFQGTVPLPPGLAVWGIDSGIRHAVTGADYGAVRVGAFMGYRILADLAGLTVTPGERPGHVHVDDHRWDGYLANVGPGTFLEFEHAIPGSLAGATFLSRYGGTTDLVTDVDPARTYAVWTPTAHPIYEHARVTEWEQLLMDTPARAAFAQTPSESASAPDVALVESAIPLRLGALMYQSHASYSKCGLGSDGTDLLVQLARGAGEASGIYGAKITGGGSGGTVAILGRVDAGPRVAAIARDYEAQTGRRAYVFEGSSPGAAAVGAVRVERPPR